MFVLIFDHFLLIKTQCDPIVLFLSVMTISRFEQKKTNKQTKTLLLRLHYIHFELSTSISVTDPDGPVHTLHQYEHLI